MRHLVSSPRLTAPASVLRHFGTGLMSVLCHSRVFAPLPEQGSTVRRGAANISAANGVGAWVGRVPGDSQAGQAQSVADTSGGAPMRTDALAWPNFHRARYPMSTFDSATRYRRLSGGNDELCMANSNAHRVNEAQVQDSHTGVCPSGCVSWRGDGPMPVAFGGTWRSVRASSSARPRMRWTCGPSFMARLVRSLPTTQLLRLASGERRQSDQHTNQRSDFHANAALTSHFFDEFFLEHRASVASYFLRLTADPHLAEDLAQDTFFAVWEGRATLMRHPAPVRWLFKVATTTGLDYFRRLRARNGGALPLLDDQRSPERGIEDQVADRDVIDRAIRRLPPKMRQAWLLREVYGFSLDEVADILSMHKGAVKRALSRARERLIRLCQVDDEDGDEGWQQEAEVDEGGEHGLGGSEEGEERYES
jgi:RNA polymerase sigma factor (sigma-70 family)